MALQKLSMLSEEIQDVTSEIVTDSNGIKYYIKKSADEVILIKSIVQERKKDGYKHAYIRTANKWLFDTWKKFRPSNFQDDNGEAIPYQEHFREILALSRKIKFKLILVSIHDPIIQLLCKEQLE